MAWAEVDEIVGVFANLSPQEGWKVWAVDRGSDAAPLRAVVYGSKRHAEWTGEGLAAGRLEDATETGLGGTYADPAGMPGRVVALDGFRRWSMAAVRREVDYALARADDPDAVRPAGPAPWDDPDANGGAFPALRRYMVKTPAVAGELPACFGLY